MGLSRTSERKEIKRCFKDTLNTTYCNKVTTWICLELVKEKKECDVLFKDTLTTTWHLLWLYWRLTYYG